MTKEDPVNKYQAADDFHVQLNFPFKASIFVAVVTIVLDVSFYIFSESVTETLIFGAATAAAAGTVLASFYTARALNLQINSLQSTSNACTQLQRTEAKKFALDFAARWNDPSMYRARRMCREIVNIKNMGLQELNAKINSGTNIDEIIHMLNFLEEVAIAKDEEVADSELLKDIFSDIFYQTWSVLELWIVDYRKERRAPDIWEAFEKLQAEWKNGAAS